MKKFLVLFLVIAFVCSCKGKKQNLAQELLGDKAEEQRIAAMEFMAQETELPEVIKKTEPAKTEKTSVKTNKTEVKNTKTDTSKTTAKQDEKPSQVKQEENQPTQAEEKTQTQGDEQTVEIRLDPNNLPKEILKTKDGRLTHPWYFMQISTDTAGMETPAWFGEELTFKLSWAFITAGEATITANKLLYNGKEYAYQIETLAKSYSVIDKVFKVRDINMSWIKSDLSKSLGYWQSVREGSYSRDEWLNFDYKTNMFTMYKLDRHGNYSKFLTHFTGTEVFDILSALYYVRNPKVSLQNTIYFDVVNVNTQYPLKVIVHGKEKIKTKAGTFNCIVVEPMISGDSIFVSKGKSLKVWITDDEYRMPVKMTVEVFIGAVKAELDSYKRGTNL